MRNAPSPAGLTSPLFEITWEQDVATRMDPGQVTSFLREQVPVLEFVDWKITSVDPGVAETLLPLNPPSTNQHFTHQAALIVLSADYTGGAALATLLWGWPVVGVHPVDSPKSVSLWLLKAEMKYLRPSTADLTVRAEVDESRREKIQKRFMKGKPVIESLTMQFMNGEEVVAEGTCTYFLRQSAALRSSGIESGKVNTLYALKLTSSAEMIAGVRALESGELFEDPYAERMAGRHGMAVAARFCERTPQLGNMVAARTKHLDDVVANFTAAGGRDIVNVGVGWDMRPYRLDVPEGTRFYELDFPTTLDERELRINQHGVPLPEGVARQPIPIDLRTMSLKETVQGILPSDRPLLLVWEGMSMYFDDQEVKEILVDMRSLLGNEHSLLWMDMVDREPVVNPSAFPGTVQDFMRGMQILGEPFIFGSDTPAEFIEDCGLRCLEVVTSDVYFPDSAEPVYSIYQFCTVAGPAAQEQPKTFRRTDVRRRPGSVPQPHFNGFTGSPVTAVKREPSK